MRIFLSFASRDRDLALEVAARLKSDGHRVFVDQSSLEPGIPYDAVIRDEVARADLFVFLVSPESVARGSYARTELDLFESRRPNPGRRLFLVEVRETEDAVLPAYLRGIHILRRSGNLVAELVAHVEKRARLRRRRAAAVVATIAIAGAGGSIAAANWPTAPATQARDVGVPIDASAFTAPDLDPTLAARARVVTVVNGAMWLGAADPDELLRLDENGHVVESGPLPGTPAAIGPVPDGDALLVGVAGPQGPQLVRWDARMHRPVSSVAISIPPGPDSRFAQTPYAVDIDEDHEIWIATSDRNGQPALATLERDDRWKLRLDDVPNDVERVTFASYGGMLFVLTSGSPGYIYRLASKGIWQVSGHEVDWVGCLDAVTTAGDPWLGVSCDREVVEIRPATWPALKRDGPTEAPDALTQTPRIHGLGAVYPSSSFAAVALVHEQTRVAVAMEHLDRSQVPYQYLESVIAMTDDDGRWTELARMPEHIRSLAMHDGLIVAVTERGARAFRLARR
jgi:hypothetical protein